MNIHAFIGVFKNQNHPPPGNQFDEVSFKFVFEDLVIFFLFQENKCIDLKTLVVALKK